MIKTKKRKDLKKKVNKTKTKVNKTKANKTKANACRGKNNTQKSMTCDSFINSTGFNKYMNTLWNTRLKHWLNVKPSELNRYKKKYKSIFKFIVRYACVHNLGYFAEDHPENPIKNRCQLPMPDIKPNNAHLNHIMKKYNTHIMSIFTSVSK